MKATVKNLENADVGSIDLLEAVFGVKPRRDILTRMVNYQLAKKRSGNHKTKGISEISGTTAKPWAQKGTGRARQGSIRSPQWRHGGVVFGPQPRSYVSSLNKKERKAALLAALSDKFQNGSVTLLATDGLALTKTAQFATLIYGSAKAAKTGVRTLVVFAESELGSVGESLLRTGANLQNAAVTHTGALDIKDVVGFARLVLTTAANDALVARLTATEKSV